MTHTKQTESIWTIKHVKENLPTREQTSHKGTYGTGLLVAGSRDMPGAAILSGLGAMRSGIGKLEIATEPEVVPLMVSSLPEATYVRSGLQKIADGLVDLSPYRAVAIGSGILPDRLTEQAVENILNSHSPLILDAGALSRRSYMERPAPVILTPHPGEFGRITGVSLEELLPKRRYYAAKFAEELGVAIVLKGSQTVIAFPDGETWTNPTGNAALAKGGTGDTLTGMMLGMLCCHEDWKHAVLNSVFLHGACADKWSESRSSHTMLAHEISELLPEVWKSIETE